MVLTSGYSHVLAKDDAHGFALVRKPYSAEQLAQVLYEAAKQRDPPGPALPRERAEGLARRLTVFNQILRETNPVEVSISWIEL